jgi:formylglycine-generating enzyme required for sulfatase activity
VTANRLRRFDMNGNVWEWYWEGNVKYDAKSLAVDRSGAAGDFDRVVWGRCWVLLAVSTRASFRNRGTPEYRGYSMLGFA